jgi:hypothetical protein
MIKVCSTGISCLLLFSLHGFGQDTIANYEMNAGPDIDVCEGGTVMLHGEIGGDATVGMWRGGRGVFVPNRNSLEAEYTPSPEEYGSTVVMTLVASNPNKKALPGRDEMKIWVNQEPKANAGADQRICAGEKVALAGTVENKFKSVEWKSNGTGTFDDAHKAVAIYTPSAKDIEGGGLSIEFTVIPEGVCLPVTDAMIVMINPSIQFSLDREINAEAGKPVKLALQSDEVFGKVTWTSNGSGKFGNAGKAETTYMPSAEDVKKKSIVLEVTAGALTGSCETKKSTTLNLSAGKTN